MSDSVQYRSHLPKLILTVYNTLIIWMLCKAHNLYKHLNYLHIMQTTTSFVIRLNYWTFQACQVTLLLEKVPSALRSIITNKRLRLQ